MTLENGIGRPLGKNIYRTLGNGIDSPLGNVKVRPLGKKYRKDFEKLNRLASREKFWLAFRKWYRPLGKV